MSWRDDDQRRVTEMRRRRVAALQQRFPLDKLANHLFRPGSSKPEQPSCTRQGVGSIPAPGSTFS